MTMIKVVAISLLLVGALAGFVYSFFHLWRFVQLGGQPGLTLLPPERYTPEMSNAYRKAGRGFAVFAVCGGLMGFIATVWGPVVI